MPLLLEIWLEQAPILNQPGLSREATGLELLQQVIHVMCLLWQRLPIDVRAPRTLHSAQRAHRLTAAHTL